MSENGPGQVSPRIAAAVRQYQEEEDISLARAAELAGVSSMRMRDILFEHGVKIRWGPATVEELQAEIATMRKWFREDSEQH
jgi:predicted HTH domain antitoxin